MSKKVNYVYQTTDPLTGEFYIGKHLGYIDDNYKGSGNWIVKHEDKNRLVKEILAKDISDEYAMYIEGVYIKMNKENPLNRNINGGWSVADKKKKRSKSNKTNNYEYKYYLDEFERMVIDMKQAQADILRANEKLQAEIKSRKRVQPSRELAKLLYL